MLVYRKTQESSWADRCYFLEEGYNDTKIYTHRSILNNEVVIEYDKEDKKENLKLAEEVIIKLRKDGIKYSAWSSGNKSVHIHFFFDPKHCTNLPLLKNSIMRHYGQTDKALPDLRLASEGHLIRCECGLHEKTQEQKKLLFESQGYPEINELPNDVWGRYVSEEKKVLNWKMTSRINQTDITNKVGFKYILSPEFKDAGDGRERAMYMIIMSMKGQYVDRQKEFIDFLFDWYKYCSGYKMSRSDIEKKVKSHWKKESYITERYLNELLESIGRSDLILKE